MACLDLMVKIFIILNRKETATQYPTTPSTVSVKTSRVMFGVERKTGSFVSIQTPKNSRLTMYPKHVSIISLIMLFAIV